MKPSQNQSPIRHHALFLKSRYHLSRYHLMATLMAATLFLFIYHQANHRHAQVTNLTQRALQMTSELDHGSTVAYPLHQAENCSYRGITLKPWQVACQSQRLFCDFSFDDRTYTCVRMVGSFPASRPIQMGPSNEPSNEMEMVSHKPLVAATAEEAMQIGLRTLKTLKMLPKDCLIALDTLPHYAAGHNHWHMSWSIKTPNSPVYHVHVNIDRETGFPVWVNDTRY